MKYIFYFNLLTGEVAMTNDDWLWLSASPIMPPDEKIVALYRGELKEFQGWKVAYIFNIEYEKEKVCITEEEFDRFFLVTTAENRGWVITDLETGEPASFGKYICAICIRHLRNLRETDSVVPGI